MALPSLLQSSTSLCFMQDRRTVLSQQVAVLTVEINLLAVKHVRQKCFRLWNCLCDVSHRQ